MRDRLWAKADRSSPAAWAKTERQIPRDGVAKADRKTPRTEHSANVRTRKVLEDPAYTGYEVMIDVYPDVIAGGILFIADRFEAGRTTAGCRLPARSRRGADGHDQHNGGGIPVLQGIHRRPGTAGLITYAPQNPYRGMDRFRSIQRQSNPLGRSLFSYIIPQHERTLEWLATLPNVDPERIGFYGLSYGGKTAVRVPTMLPRYALSICSGDFNEWVRKNATNARQVQLRLHP